MSTGSLDKEMMALMLLKAIIFHYHGLDEDEEKILYESAGELGAEQELKWAIDFIAEDYVTAFERARSFMNDNIDTIEKRKRLQFMNLTWQANSKKGYITEMEATAMLKIAKDWQVDQELIAIIQPN